jgi:hypothetical protein
MHTVADLIPRLFSSWQLSIVASAPFPYSLFTYTTDSARMLTHGSNIVDQYVLHMMSLFYEKVTLDG